jgi:hypothetical protein
VLPRKMPWVSGTQLRSTSMRMGRRWAARLLVESKPIQQKLRAGHQPRRGWHRGRAVMVIAAAIDIAGVPARQNAVMAHEGDHDVGKIMTDALAAEPGLVDRRTAAWRLQLQPCKEKRRRSCPLLRRGCFRGSLEVVAQAELHAAPLSQQRAGNAQVCAGQSAGD